MKSSAWPTRQSSICPGLWFERCDLRMTSKMSPGSGLVELGVAMVAVQAAAQSLRGDVEGRIERTGEAARRPTLHLWGSGFPFRGPDLRRRGCEGFAADWDGKRNKRGPGSTVWRCRRSARGFDGVNRGKPGISTRREKQGRSWENGWTQDCTAAERGPESGCQIPERLRRAEGRSALGTRGAKRKREGWRKKKRNKVWSQHEGSPISPVDQRLQPRWICFQDCRTGRGVRVRRARVRVCGGSVD